MPEFCECGHPSYDHLFASGACGSCICNGFRKVVATVNNDIEALRAFDYDSDRVPSDLESAIYRVIARVEESEQALERVRAVIKNHVDFQLASAARFGRVDTDCICEACQVYRALEGEPNG